MRRLTPNKHLLSALRIKDLLASLLLANPFGGLDTSEYACKRTCEMDEVLFRKTKPLLNNRRDKRQERYILTGEETKIFIQGGVVNDASGNELSCTEKQQTREKTCTSTVKNTAANELSETGGPGAESVLLFDAPALAFGGVGPAAIKRKERDTRTC